MSDQERLQRLANVLYGVASVMFGGTFLELLAAKHFQEPLQLVPIVITLASLVLILTAWKRPGRSIINLMRAAMVITAPASLLGVWKHIEEISNSCERCIRIPVACRWSSGPSPVVHRSWRLAHW